jgi:polyphosphate kinase 2 (PPK2 family)
MFSPPLIRKEHRRQLQATDRDRARARLSPAHPSARAGKGQIVIFNRSHYEDVLVTRVHKLIDKNTWADRYQRIRDFEALLAKNGAAMIKFFLHISKEEQLARFEQSLDDPNRSWKISESDYSALWDN